MKKQIYAIASTLLLSANAYALDLKAFLSDTHKSHANYNYAEANVLFQPHDTTGFDLRGSYVFRPNTALVGVFSRVTADVLNVDVTGSQFGVGGRYFFELRDLDRTDIDLSAVLMNYRVKAGSVSDTDTGVLLGAQMRHLLGQPVGSSSMTFEEVYGGIQLGISGEETSAAIHTGLLVALNQQFSAHAEILVDDGTYLTLGVRMKLGQPQRDPGMPGSSALQRQKPLPAVMRPAAKPEKEQSEAAVITPSAASPELKANPFGLSEDEMADLNELN